MKRRIVRSCLVASMLVLFPCVAGAANDKGNSSDNGNGKGRGNGGVVSVPELTIGAAGGALVVLGGGYLILRGRRRKTL